ncbi:hypothetical protein GUITHDRAFT_118489 [Guillardia theta CCMP2712]|uniref:Uncharacterized protein n=1 Tax=Guillardia theta (strain CCMP2712) TaxID=905079 RepID=L1IGM1_GUITC|nr:hypothetical protein GUITHDRAFT_118489 [Guillardia theta CCMP2712]EKX35368.1 hypothetical protein GUITHDRAFT_118489 [Guillardia theta CCMP2712]|eukprot:XP_005822348.1 hypothetical protein GUITHDRAFT_118489 [Guillardia theta CCMP2712]
MRSFVSATKLPYGSKQVREMFLSLIALSKRGKARMTVDDFRSFFKKYVDKNDALLVKKRLALYGLLTRFKTFATSFLVAESADIVVDQMFLFRVEHVGSGAGGYEPKRVMKEYSSNRILKMSALEEQMSQLELQIAEAANSIKPGRFADIGLTVDTIIDGAVDVEQVWTASRLSLSHAHPPAMRKTKTPEPRVQEEVSGSFARTSSLRRSNNESRTLELIEEQSEVYEHDSFRRKSRFLGDGEHEFDDAALSPKQDMTAEILETLKMSNEMCERTIHDICTWSKEWLEEMLETFRSCVDEDGLALKDVESWTEQVVNDEMTIVQTLFPNLEVRFQHIFLLLSTLIFDC